MRACNTRDFVIDLVGADAEVAAFGDQVPNAVKILLVGGGIVRLAFALKVPGIDPGLQFVALGQQGAVPRRQLADDFGEAMPGVFR